MPIEIRELVIKATVGDPASEGARNAAPNGSPADTREADVNLIVEKVLEILKEKSER
jgi:hypothetical protein